jgi:hypothetical protein
MLVVGRWNVVYELWNTRTRNLVDSLSTETAALSAARKIIETNGPEYARHLALAREDRRGKTRLIASGADLVVHIDRPAAMRAARPDREHALCPDVASDRPADERSKVSTEGRTC